MAYAISSCVAALCRNLVAGASDFDTSTSPTQAQVNSWLSSGCALINNRLGSAGYGAIPATSGAYDLAAQANALYAAWMAERSRINARTTSDERTRADMLKKDFEYMLEALVNDDLSRQGVSQSGTVYAGGISRSDKDAVEGNSDRVAPRFVSGQFKHPDNKSNPGGFNATTDDYD